MDTKKIALFVLTLSFVLIVSGSVSSFVVGLKADRRDTLSRMYEVNDSFEVFSTNTTVFENMRDTLYTDVLSKLYFDTMYEQDKDVKTTLSNYEHLVDELMKNTYELNSLCDKVYYPDRTVNSRCKNYKSIYEQIVNYFVSDINLYNSNIDKYNEYQASLGSLYRLRKYDTTRTYIDYNQDNQYDGREE